MFDLLINAEVIVDDVALAERVFVDALGFPPPRASWRSTAPGHGFTWLFARVHPSLATAPTRIEAMALAPVDPAIDPARTLPFLPRLLAAQGRRPWKTHANEIASSDVRAVAQRLAERGCRFHEMPGEFTRLWLGWTADDPGAYRPDVDGGLFLEVCETASLRQGPAFWDEPPEPDLPPGSMVRVLRRSWIVEDLASTLEALAENLGLRPSVGPELDTDLGSRRAVLRFAHPRSAELELLEPVAAGEMKDSLEAWGPGAWAIRIGVDDLEAKAADLRRRATAFEARSRGAVLRVDTGPLGVPGLFDFVQLSPSGTPCPPDSPRAGSHRSAPPTDR
jgi:hypothetical protein